MRVFFTKLLVLTGIMIYIAVEAVGLGLQKYIPLFVAIYIVLAIVPDTIKYLISKKKKKDNANA